MTFVGSENSFENFKNEKIKEDAQVPTFPGPGSIIIYSSHKNIPEKYNSRIVTFAAAVTELSAILSPDGNLPIILMDETTELYPIFHRQMPRGLLPKLWDNLDKETSDFKYKSESLESLPSQIRPIGSIHFEFDKSQNEVGEEYFTLWTDSYDPREFVRKVDLLSLGSYIEVLSIVALSKMVQSTSQAKLEISTSMNPSDSRINQLERLNLKARTDYKVRDWLLHHAEAIETRFRNSLL